MVAGSWLTGTMHMRNRLNRGGVRVLMYHRFGDWPRDPFCVSEADFEAQVQFVAERGLAISLEDIAEFLRGQRRLPEGAVMLTCDDGAQSVLTKAAPILKRYAVPMVAFVTTRAIDGQEPQNVDRSRGAFIAFPSFMLHRVTPVTRGTRWSLVAWILGTRWR